MHTKATRDAPAIHRDDTYQHDDAEDGDEEREHRHGQERLEEAIPAAEDRSAGGEIAGGAPIRGGAGEHSGSVPQSRNV